MKQLTSVLLFLAITACGFTGCDSAEDTQATGGNPGSETHWLTLCDSSDECGDGVCSCGVCTVTCDSNSDCGALSSDLPLSCVAPSSVAGCAAPSGSSSTCQATCEDDADCESLGSEATCQEAVCSVEGTPAQTDDDAAGAPTSTDNPSPTNDSGTTGDDSTGDDSAGTLDSGSNTPGDDASSGDRGTDASTGPDGGEEMNEGGAASNTDEEPGPDSGPDMEEAGTSDLPDATIGEDPALSLPECESEEPLFDECPEVSNTCGTSDSCCVCAFNPDSQACGRYWACVTPKNNADVCPEDPPGEDEACVVDGPLAQNTCSYCLAEGPLLMSCGRAGVGSDVGVWSTSGFDDWCQE